MLSYRIALLKKTEDLKLYSELYVNNGGDQAVPLDWMERSKVFGIYHGSQMVGGYVECCPPIRSTRDVPDEIRQALLEKHCGNLQNVQENAAFWIKRNTKDKVILQTFVWATIVWRSVFCTKCNYTLGVANRKGISNLYKFFCGKVIYQAPSKLIPGETYHVFLWSKGQLLSVGGKIILRFFRARLSRFWEGVKLHHPSAK
jgi:hypothetical protein